ncbi:hypothetical protein F5146DRAFT_1222168 [Armillaria mellea]|nr:hypothetical protein F5146DRAFT_1222168 [Armillaria mellea]
MVPLMDVERRSHTKLTYRARQHYAEDIEFSLKEDWASKDSQFWIDEMEGVRLSEWMWYDTRNLYDHSMPHEGWSNPWYNVKLEGLANDVAAAVNGMVVGRVEGGRAWREGWFLSSLRALRHPQHDTTTASMPLTVCLPVKSSILHCLMLPQMLHGDNTWYDVKSSSGNSVVVTGWTSGRMQGGGRVVLGGREGGRVRMEGGSE